MSEEELAKDAKRPRFTIIFDREAYEPKFFKSRWEKYRIAVITYRKAVKDKWAVEEFADYKALVIGKEVNMKLAEQRVLLSDIEMREIRKLSDSGHQTSIVTTNEQIVIETVVGKMFSRWSQENFFRYMMQDYDLDKLAEYGVEAIDPQKKVVNPSYKKLNDEIKKLREKQNRLKAKFFQIIEKDLEQMKEKIQQQAELQEKIASYQIEINEKLKVRKQTSYLDITLCFQYAQVNCML